MKRTVALEDGTVGALRAALAEVADAPDTAELRVTTRFKLGIDGQPLAKLTVTDP